MLFKFENYNDGIFSSELEYKNTMIYIDKTINIFGKIPFICSIILAIIIRIYISTLKDKIKESEFKINDLRKWVSHQTIANHENNKKQRQNKLEWKIEKCEFILTILVIVLQISMVGIVIDFIYEAYRDKPDGETYNFKLIKIFALTILGTIITAIYLRLWMLFLKANFE